MSSEIAWRIALRRAYEKRRAHLGNMPWTPEKQSATVDEVVRELEK